MVKEIEADLGNMRRELEIEGGDYGAVKDNKNWQELNEDLFGEWKALENARQNQMKNHTES